jgi:hypothetical protein
MPVYKHVRTKGQCLTYAIEYSDGEYYIERDGQMKKSIPDGIVVSIVPSEATADLMLRTAIADIENLIGMDE